MEKICDQCKEHAAELRRLPLNIERSGWICPPCWQTQWKPHWPEWRSLIDYDWLYNHGKDPRQQELFPEGQ